MAAAEEPLAPKLFWWEGAQALPHPVWEQEQDRMVLGTGSGGRVLLPFLMSFVQGKSLEARGCPEPGAGSLGVCPATGEGS